MYARHLVRIASILSLLTLVLFKFQNCAPTNPGEDFAQSPDGEVRIVDRWQTANKIEFMSPSYLVEETVEAVNVQGLCVGLPKGSRLAWQLADTVAGVIESGVAECQMGNFQLQVKSLHFSDCNSRLELKAQAENSSEAPAITVFRPFCDS
jgi:hypothetical protein